MAPQEDKARGRSCTYSTKQVTAPTPSAPVSSPSPVHQEPAECRPPSFARNFCGRLDESTMTVCAAKPTTRTCAPISFTACWAGCPHWKQWWARSCGYRVAPSVPSLSTIYRVHPCMRVNGRAGCAKGHGERGIPLGFCYTQQQRQTRARENVLR